MTDALEETLKLTEGDVSLVRGVKLMHGDKVGQIGDHMVVTYLTGNQEDVIVFHDAEQLTAKRLVRKMEFQVPMSTHSPASTNVVHDLAPLDADSEKRLLAIYKKFPRAGSGR